MGFTTFPRDNKWTKPSFTSLAKEQQTPAGSLKLRNSISSLVEERINDKSSIPNNSISHKPRFNSLANNPRFVSTAEHNEPKRRFKKNSISSLVEEQVVGSSSSSSSSSNSNSTSQEDFTSLVSKDVVEKKEEEEGEEEPKPRFTMFGKKAKFTEINNRSLEQDQKAIEANTIATSKKKRISGKFEYHPSTKQRKRKMVHFNPIFLERVCLFLEEQSPCELKEAHDKQLSNPPFRIICSHWPSQDTTNTTIVLNKKSFSISPDNTCIRGKLMIHNLALDKSVLIRYTFDAWTTIRDVDASFFGPNPKHTAYDIYEFTMDLDHRQLADRGEMRGRLEFAIRYTMGEKDYWDNNHDKDYQIKILSDPLNDPWKKKHQQLDSSDEEEEEIEEREEEGGDDREEKHSQFANALKGYKHAKPYHLNKRQPWLGTRYDFGQSLYLAKVSPYDAWTPALEPDPSFIADFLPDPNTPCKVSEPVYPPTSVSAPPSPTASPTLLPPSNDPNTLEFNSTFYQNLLDKYCFYTPTDEYENTLVQSPLQPFIEQENTPFQEL